MSGAIGRLALCGLLLLAAVTPAGAAQLSLCQGHFEAVRGPSYRYELSQDSAELPPGLVNELERSARAIYENWESLLSAEPPFLVSINLRVLSERKAFEALKSELAPNLPDVNGFYSGQGNLAVALHEPGNPEETRRRALHEISHVVTAAQTGAAPHWLAEGLAEFHEMIAPVGDALQVLPNGRHYRYLDPGKLPTLKAYFSQPAEAWYSQDSQKLYGVAWSLVYFLMQSPEGRGALGYTLQQSSTHSCQPYSAAGFLGRAWPGGLSDLEQRWRNWLEEGEFKPIPLG